MATTLLLAEPGDQAIARPVSVAVRQPTHPTCGLVDLLRRRPDLRGVHDLADLLAEATVWST